MAISGMVSIVGSLSGLPGRVLGRRRGGLFMTVGGVMNLWVYTYLGIDEILDVPAFIILAVRGILTLSEKVPRPALQS